MYKVVMENGDDRNVYFIANLLKSVSEKVLKIVELLNM